MFSDDIMVPAWRPGPWAVKKAFQSLLDKVLGYHVTWSTVAPKPVIQRSKSNASTWDATDDEIDQGRKYIIDHCPVDEAESDLTTWIWKKIEPDSGSPIAGWPEMKARKIAENKKKASQGVAIHCFFPPVFFDMKFICSTVLMPIMIPLFTECGLLLLGRQGAGKTPTVAILSMLMGRWLVRCGSAHKAGWRRGKCWDDFKDRLSTVHCDIQSPTHIHIQPAIAKH